MADVGERVKRVNHLTTRLNRPPHKVGCDVSQLPPLLLLQQRRSSRHLQKWSRPVRRRTQARMASPVQRQHHPKTEERPASNPLQAVDLSGLLFGHFFHSLMIQPAAASPPRADGGMTMRRHPMRKPPPSTLTSAVPPSPRAVGADKASSIAGNRAGTTYGPSAARWQRPPKSSARRPHLLTADNCQRDVGHWDSWKKSTTRMSFLSIGPR